MARLSEAQIKSIVARDLPGYQVVGHTKPAAAADHRAPATEDVAAEIETPTRAYETPRVGVGRRLRFHLARGRREERLDADDTFEDELVTVEPEHPSASLDPRSLQKAVVISGEDGRVIGSQG